MLSKFLTCRVRFGVRYMEGLVPAPAFNHKIFYGSVWHACEEVLAAGGTDPTETARRFAADEAQKFPLAREQISKWTNVCLTQFKVYTEYWVKHEQVRNRTPLLQEQVFKVPYRLPASGRVVYLRGRWDAVDVIGHGKSAAIYLFETKTKGDVDPEMIQRQLSWDLQTMLYLVALEGSPVPLRNLNKPFKDYDPETTKLTQDELNGLFKKAPIAGVRYNVVRRPLSGGKGSIVQHKPTKSNPDGESAEAYYARLGQVIRENADTFFARFQVEVGPADVRRFREKTLDPLLEQLCDWYLQQTEPDNYRYALSAQTAVGYVTPLNFVTPFGGSAAVGEYGIDEVDNYLMSGAAVGLTRADALFEELAE